MYKLNIFLLLWILNMNLLFADKDITISKPLVNIEKQQHLKTNNKETQVDMDNIFNLTEVKNIINHYKINFEKINKDKISYQTLQLLIYTLFYLFLMLLLLILFRYKVKQIYYTTSTPNISSDTNEHFDFSHINISHETTEISETRLFNIKNFVSLFIIITSIIFYYFWYVFVYKYSIDEEAIYRNNLEQKINIQIIDRQNKTNLEFFRKLQKDTKTLSLLVDSLKETRELGNKNNHKFVEFLNELTEQIEDNKKEMKSLLDIKPITNGTIITFD